MLRFFFKTLFNAFFFLYLNLLQACEYQKQIKAFFYEKFIYDLKTRNGLILSENMDSWYLQYENIVQCIFENRRRYFSSSS